MPLSRLGLGCSRFGSFNSAISLPACRALVEAARLAGVTVFDTANIYGQGDSERVLGRALLGHREEVFLITKAGRGFSPAMRTLAPLKPLIRNALALRRKKGGRNLVTAQRERALRFDWSPEAIRSSLADSLHRLRTDWVDGFLLHSPPAQVAGRSEIASLLSALRAEGRVRHFGVSCDDVACLDAALAMPGLTMVQIPWDVLTAIDAARAAQIEDRGILLILREVVRQQPLLSPLDAVAGALREKLVDCTLIGTTSKIHLREMAALSGFEGGLAPPAS